LQLDVDVAVVVVRSHLGVVGQDVVRNIRILICLGLLSVSPV
jgi:hypothetical protein